MVRILVEDEDHITPLCTHHCPTCAKFELGDLVVVDTLDINGSAESVVRDQPRVVARNTAVSASVN